MPAKQQPIGAKFNPTLSIFIYKSQNKGENTPPCLRLLETVKPTDKALQIIIYVIKQYDSSGQRLGRHLEM